ncbi:MAG: LAGLIDADG family homing endonuclease, partial [archaeon]|nr:LAGLIDADG family homing endonuclease [archaeon]
MVYDIIIGRNKSDIKKFGDKGLVYLGKGYVKMGNYTSLSNMIWLDVVRSHVIMIAGKRGSGKCLYGDTLINLADGSQMPIKDLENNKEQILSLNEKFKIEPSEKTEFFSREVEKLLKIKFRSGKEIKLTPEHPLLTIKGWTPAQELKIGGRIATPRKSLFGNNEMPEHEIKLLAYLLAEGHLSNGFCLFSNIDEKINKDFIESIHKFDDNLKINIHSKEGCFRISQKVKAYKLSESKRNQQGQFTSGGVRYEKSSINKWLINLGVYGKLSVNKFFPENIMKLKKEQLAIFLNRLFSCDGSIYCKTTQTGKTWQISYASSSEKMIRQVQNLLLKFGILSKLRERMMRLDTKEFKSFELILNAENVIKFVEEIGFFGKKQEREFEAKHHSLSVERNSNIDTIPKELWETYEPKNWAEIGRAYGYKHPKAMRERIRYSPSRQTLLKIAEIDKNNPLYLLATSDIFWDEIVSIELLEGKFKVYDLCVPGNHNFVANDIIVHNSYTLGAIAEELCDLPEEVSQNIAPLIFDTMGIFWTMKYKNEKESELLQEWNLKPKNLPVTVWAPQGYYHEYEKRQIPVDKKFAIKASELEAEDWVITFELEMTNPNAIIIQRIVSNLKDSKNDFDIDTIIQKIHQDNESEPKDKQSCSALFEAANTWGIFSKKGEKGTEINELLTAGKTTVLDISCYSSIGTFNVRALVIGLVCKKLFNQRMLARKKEEMISLQHGMDYLNVKQKKEFPLVWIFIDEAHEFLRKEQNEKTAATDALI